MAKTKQRRAPVRMDRFKKQFTEEVIAEGSLEPIEIGEDQQVWIKLPILLDEDDNYQEQLREAYESDDEDAVPLVVLGQHPDHDPAEQWAAWKSAGYDATDLASILRVQTNAAQERLNDFRYGG
jgi:hypothetical protein